MTSSLRRFIISCGLLSLLGVLLFIVGAITNERFTHAYLFWNLFLAWIPLLLALAIHRYSNDNGLKKPALRASILAVWVLFLPNAFYLLTDYIHVTEIARVDPVFDSVMFSTVISVGCAIGIASLLIVHRSLLRIMSRLHAQIIIGVAIAACSFAIYLGRELRFNSWDIITNPLQLVSEIMRIVIEPSNHLQAYVTSLTFFIVILAVYMATWWTLGLPTKKG